MLSKSVIKRVVSSAEQNYGAYPEVCAVSLGAKYSSGERLSNVEAVQFFVTEKKDKSSLKKQLPRHVYKRTQVGELVRSVRILTDVIELRNLELCCFAGDEVASVGGSTGSVTLIFENKTSDNRKFIVTCSHVAGDLTVSPAPGELRGGESVPGGCLFTAHVLANTVAKGGHVEFDIGIGEIKSATGFTDLGVGNEMVRFAGFARPDDLARDNVVDCLSQISAAGTAMVVSELASFRQVKTPLGSHVTIHNLIACRGVAELGDSGGIVYLGDRAVGMIVARADDDWMFIHPLQEAISHLGSISGLELVCFT